MPRYIDADRLNKDVLASWDKDKHVTLEASRVHRQEHHHLMRIIEKQPTADVVEVVRCKDCPKYRADVAPRSEVAREIFEELDEALAYALESHPFAIARYNEIKKKYKGDNK